MDNRKYQSESVKKWCEEHKVCPDGRDLAMHCNDLRTVWFSISRPAWLMWFHLESGKDQQRAMIEWNGLNSIRLEQGKELITLDMFQYIDADACHVLRDNIPCPFDQEAVNPCSNPALPVCDDGSRDVADYLLTGDKDALIRHQSWMLSHHEGNARFWRRMAVWTLFGAYFGAVVAILLVKRIRKEDEAC